MEPREGQETHTAVKLVVDVRTYVRRFMKYIGYPNKVADGWMGGWGVGGEGKI